MFSKYKDLPDDEVNYMKNYKFPTCPHKAHRPIRIFSKSKYIAEKV
jgi:hypothetical protein